MPGNGIHRPPALRRSQHGCGVPGLEAERRRFVGAGLHLVAAAERGGHRLCRRVVARHVAHQQHRLLPLGGDRGGPVDGGGRRRFLSRLLSRRVHQHGILRGDHHVQRAARPLRRTEPDPHHVRLGARTRRRCALRRREWELVARLRGVAGRLAGCTSYTCGAARRLFVAPISLPSVTGQVPCNAPASPYGYYMVATDGGVFNYGNLPFCGSRGPSAEQTRGGHGGHARRRRLLAGGERRGDLLLRRRPVLRLCRFVAVEQADRGHGGHVRRRGLLAGGERRRHLQLRRRQVLRLSRVPPPQRGRSWAWRRRTTAAATGWWRATAASSLR